MNEGGADVVTLQKIKHLTFVDNFSPSFYLDRHKKKSFNAR